MKSIATAKQDMAVLPLKDAFETTPFSSVAFAKTIIDRFGTNDSFMRPVEMIHKTDDETEAPKAAQPNYDVNLQLTIEQTVEKEGADRSEKEFETRTEKLVERLVRERTLLEKAAIERARTIENNYHIAVKNAFYRRDAVYKGAKQRTEGVLPQKSAVADDASEKTKSLAFGKVLKRNQEAGVTAYEGAPEDMRAFKSQLIRSPDGRAYMDRATLIREIERLEREAQDRTDLRASTEREAFIESGIRAATEDAARRAGYTDEAKADFEAAGAVKQRETPEYGDIHSGAELFHKTDEETAVQQSADDMSRRVERAVERAAEREASRAATEAKREGRGAGEKESGRTAATEHTDDKPERGKAAESSESSERADGSASPDETEEQKRDAIVRAAPQTQAPETTYAKTEHVVNAQDTQYTRETWDAREMRETREMRDTPDTQREQGFDRAEHTTPEKERADAPRRETAVDGERTIGDPGRPQAEHLRETDKESDNTGKQAPEITGDTHTVKRAFTESASVDEGEADHDARTEGAFSRTAVPGEAPTTHSELYHAEPQENVALGSSGRTAEADKASPQKSEGDTGAHVREERHSEAAQAVAESRESPLHSSETENTQFQSDGEERRTSGAVMADRALTEEMSSPTPAQTVHAQVQTETRSAGDVDALNDAKRSGREEQKSATERDPSHREGGRSFQDTHALTGEVRTDAREKSSAQAHSVPTTKEAQQSGRQGAARTAETGSAPETELSERTQIGAPLQGDAHSHPVETETHGDLRTLDLESDIARIATEIQIARSVAREGGATAPVETAHLTTTDDSVLSGAARAAQRGAEREKQERKTDAESGYQDAHTDVTMGGAQADGEREQAARQLPLAAVDTSAVDNVYRAVPTETAHIDTSAHDTRFGESKAPQLRQSRTLETANDAKEQKPDKETTDGSATGASTSRQHVEKDGTEAETRVGGLTETLQGNEGRTIAPTETVHIQASTETPQGAETGAPRVERHQVNTRESADHARAMGLGQGAEQGDTATGTANRSLSEQELASDDRAHSDASAAVTENAVARVSMADAAVVLPQAETVHAGSTETAAQLRQGDAVHRDNTGTEKAKPADSETRTPEARTAHSRADAARGTDMSRGDAHHTNGEVETSNSAAQDKEQRIARLAQTEQAGAETYPQTVHAKTDERQTERTEADRATERDSAIHAQHHRISETDATGRVGAVKSTSADTTRPERETRTALQSAETHLGDAGKTPFVDDGETAETQPTLAREALVEAQFAKNAVETVHAQTETTVDGAFDDSARQDRPADARRDIGQKTAEAPSKQQPFTGLEAVLARFVPEIAREQTPVKTFHAEDRAQSANAQKDAEAVRKGAEQYEKNADDRDSGAVSAKSAKGIESAERTQSAPAEGELSAKTVRTGQRLTAPTLSHVESVPDAAKSATGKTAARRTEATRLAQTAQAKADEAGPIQTGRQMQPEQGSKELPQRDRERSAAVDTTKEKENDATALSKRAELGGEQRAGGAQTALTHLPGEDASAEAVPDRTKRAQKALQESAEVGAQDVAETSETPDRTHVAALQEQTSPASAPIGLIHADMTSASPDIRVARQAAAQGRQRTSAADAAKSISARAAKSATPMTAFAAPKTQTQISAQGAMPKLEYAMPTAIESAARRAGDAVSPNAAGSAYRESEYVKTLPGWARDFLRQSYESPEGQTDQAQATYPPMRAFANGSANGEQMAWSAPGYVPPNANMTHKQKKEQKQQEMPPLRFTDAEIRRMANKVYGLIEDRMRRDNRRKGL